MHRISFAYFSCGNGKRCHLLVIIFAAFGIPRTTHLPTQSGRANKQLKILSGYGMREHFAVKNV